MTDQQFRQLRQMLQTLTNGLQVVLNNQLTNEQQIASLQQQINEVLSSQTTLLEEVASIKAKR